MKDGITLHPRLGVNPRLTFCARCGGDGRDLILLGDKNYKFTCEEGHVSFGSRRCLFDSCGRRGEVADIGEHEKLPSTCLCVSCETEVAAFKAEVEAGGVYFRCQDCKAEGVVKADAEMAIRVREQLKVPAPAPAGVEFDKSCCPQCRDAAVKDVV